MKHNQGGVKTSVVVLSVILLGVSAWFNQAHAQSETVVLQTQQSSSNTIKSV
ncbi:MAG: hypothetical protein ACTJH9_14055 [Pseudoalteromonas sp.]|uniref:hypothetical protein n=1 Tax=unclassified Pseudoalteromonas TaxID=194690 RepID=UPI003F9536C2